MPSEPKKPIEELLEASARKRRAEFGADPKMPNPMRAQLQDEVSALAQEREPVRRSGWLGMSWRRLATATAFAALVIGVVGLWWHEHQAPVASARFAVQQAPPMEKNELPSAAAAAPQLAEADKLEGPSASGPQSDIAGTAASSTLETKTLPLAKAEPFRSPLTENFRQSLSRTQLDKAQSVAQNRDEIVGNLKQQFSQSVAGQIRGNSARPKQAPKILDNFQVEQNGRDIRVVDGDGSTYTGQIERLSLGDSRNVAGKKQSYNAPAARVASAEQAKAKEEETNNEFYFRARGFNSSLKKAVVFEGNYIAGRSAPRKDADVTDAKFAEQQAGRIVGTAKVPGEPSVAIDAVAVPAK